MNSLTTHYRRSQLIALPVSPGQSSPVGLSGMRPIAGNSYDDRNIPLGH